MAVIPGNDDPNTLIGTTEADTIEAFGADDSAYGNEGDDEIFGGSGNDTLEGNADNDRIDGGSGDDHMDGGYGIDWADYSQAYGGISVDLGAQAASNDGFGDADVLLDFENVEGSSHNDFILGDDGANSLRGNKGIDFLSGFGDADLIHGGKGQDSVVGGEGNDILYGDGQADNVSGSYGEDEVFGGNGGDALSGGAQSDFIEGGKGSDVIEGQGGSDDLDGGKKGDVIYGSGGGADGADTIQGGVKDEADDEMWGGDGNDIFIISRDSGDDVIGDFESGNDSPFTDVIDLADLSDRFDDFADVAARSNQDGDDLVIELGGGSTLTLVDTLLEELDGGNFIFG